MSDSDSSTSTAARRSVSGFITRVGGRRRVVEKGQVLPGDDPVVQQRPDYFVDAGTLSDKDHVIRKRIGGKPTCVQCRGRFFREDAVQRMFCSDACFKERRKRLSRTLKDASKGKVPTGIADIEQALADVQALQLAWRGKEEPTIERPSPRARAVVMAYRSRLWKSLKQAKREAREANEERARKAAADRYREAQEDQRKRQAAAEKELVATADNI